MPFILSSVDVAKHLLTRRFATEAVEPTSRLRNGRLGFEEVEAAVTYFLADMHFHTALWTFLLVPSQWQLFGRGLLLCFCFLFRLELLFTRCIGLLHGALRMDTTRGERPLSTNRTDLRVVFAKDWSGLFVTHDAFPITMR